MCVNIIVSSCLPKIQILIQIDIATPYLLHRQNINITCQSVTVIFYFDLSILRENISNRKNGLPLQPSKADVRK